MPILAETATIIQQLEDASTTIMTDETITELQIELKSAVALASEIKSENDDLKRQLESANAFSNANLQRHAEWKEVWKKEREAVSMREKQLEREEAKWKAKLEDRRKEMDEMDMKIMLSKDAGVGGAGLLDLVKEIQAEHAKKTERLINEVRKRALARSLAMFDSETSSFSCHMSHHTTALGNQVERTMLLFSQELRSVASTS
jgi:DNA repair exonuclease SbcCD ATPase subunit